MRIEPMNISKEEKMRIFEESLKNQTPYVEKEPVKIRPVNQWISVKDELPNEMQDKSIYSGWSEEIRPSDSVLVLKNLARNPTGFRRWDEWLG